MSRESHKGLDINSLAPGKFEWNFRHVIFKQILVTDGWGISCEIVLIWVSLDLTDDQSTLVLVMAWCRQATSHYLSQCWPRSRPHCVLSPPSKQTVIMYMKPRTSQGIYNTVNFIQNNHNWRPIAHPCGWNMGVFCEFKVTVRVKYRFFNCSNVWSMLLYYHCSAMWNILPYHCVIMIPGSWFKIRFSFQV